MNIRGPSRTGCWSVQVVVLLLCASALLRGGTGSGAAAGLAQPAGAVKIERSSPLRVEPLYDDPQLVTDEELAAVLRQVLPKFGADKLKPNFVEHALRIWGADARFYDEGAMSGAQMCEFLVDHGKYLASLGPDVAPLLNDAAVGVSVRWGREPGASVHHDHWLASLSEAGVALNEQVFTPRPGTHTLADVLRQALADFRPDERETEWSALAFGLWLPPVREWTTLEGRRVSFDMLARRLLRGDQRFGVCHGTHRVYSLVVLLRLDQSFHILSDDVREALKNHLRNVRDWITESQFDDGHWPSNWHLGRRAVDFPVPDELKDKVISTGHHLEWLSIAPEEFHPPREQVRKAARWAIETTLSRSSQQILEQYTFFTHVGGALAAWRKVRPAEFLWSRATAQAGVQPAP
jgi:hypothetical protein